MRLGIIILLSGCLAGLAQAQDPAAGGSEVDYHLGVEDVLQIQIWGRPDLTGAVAVNYSGKIKLPLVGEIQAQGRSVADLSRSLTERYQLLDPSIREVIVAVSDYKSQSVTVVGEVMGPGTYAFRTIPDVWTVILTAGNVTPEADLAGVQIVRRDEQTGTSHTMAADLSAGIEATGRSRLPQLRPKDTIIVPSVDATASLGDRFQVLGAVQTPGAYRISRAERVIEAISISGGTLPNADLHNVRLTRVTSEGVVVYQLDLHGYLYDARPLADLELRAGDTVTVPTKRSSLGAVFDGLVRVAPVVSVALSLVLVMR